MSTIVQSTCDQHEEPVLARFNVIKTISVSLRFLSKALLAVALICAIGALYSCTFDASLYGFACFVEWLLGALAYSMIAEYLGKLFVIHEKAPLNGHQGKCLRMAAIGFFLLALFGFACSFTASYFATGSSPLTNIAFPGAGFPDSTMWEQAFSTSVQASSPSTIASIDLSPIVAGAVLWTMSFLFDYGAQLQQDKEGTV